MILFLDPPVPVVYLTVKRPGSSHSTASSPSRSHNLAVKKNVSNGNVAVPKN